jgi:CheY-like chemotaxis protein
MNYKLLVIEDNTGDIFLLKEALRKTSFPCELTVLSNGQSVTDYIKKINSENLPDIIIIDLIIPQTDGFEILSRLKSNPLFKNIPIIVLTTSVWTDDESKAKSLGAALFFTKPFLFDGYFPIISSIKLLLSEEKSLV